MDFEKIIDESKAFVKNKLNKAEAGHDWWHIERVYNIALQIAENETVDVFTVKLAALFHDIADSKFNNGDESIGPKIAREFLVEKKIPEEICNHVIEIIKNISFKGGNFSQVFCSKELQVVQDADRLDAMGAIGIARTFNYGGFKNRELYNPEIKPKLNMTKTEYKNSTAPTINHFYEKLLLLKDRMNTETARKMAKQRHQFMQTYLDQFFDEWKGKK